MIHYTVSARVPLLYKTNPSQFSHLSAASGVAWLQNALLVIDDASVFAGLFEPTTGTGTPLRLLPPVEGHDVFSEAAGTKKQKPDLEVVVPLPGGDLFVMGSGSRNRGTGERRWRTKAIRVSSSMQLEVFELEPLYEKLATYHKDINLEGAVFDGEGLLLFLRGNGIGGKPAVAKVKNLDSVLAHDIKIESFEEVSLPQLSGCALGFTDACRMPNGDILTALSAESSPNAYDDGFVAGSVLYHWKNAQVLPIYNQDGSPFMEKLEGICPRDTTSLFGVTDPDDPQRPGELLWLQQSA